jgi:hypothetical protein
MAKPLEVMYMMYMAKVRKQIYLEERQERLLRQRAKSLGVSEAEIIRVALDVALAPQKRSSSKHPIERFVEGVVADVAAGRVWKGGKFDRDEIYQERESRWR